jgi:hypothetical protein
MVLASTGYLHSKVVITHDALIYCGKDFVAHIGVIDNEVKELVGNHVFEIQCRMIFA